MDKRIFVEKKSNFGVKSQSLVRELTHNLQLKTLSDLRMIQVYDVFHLAEDLVARAEKHIFSEQVTDRLLTGEEVEAALAETRFLPLKRCRVSLTSGQPALRRPSFCSVLGQMSW